MVENFTEAGVAEQNKHPFAKRIHIFPEGSNKAVYALSVFPAKMDAQDLEKPIPGDILVTFSSRCTLSDSIIVREKFKSIGMQSKEYITEISETFAPPAGVITHKLMQNILTGLQETGAITHTASIAAAIEFGIPVPSLSPVTLHEPNRPTLRKVPAPDTKP